MGSLKKFRDPIGIIYLREYKFSEIQYISEKIVYRISFLILKYFLKNNFHVYWMNLKHTYSKNLLLEFDIRCFDWSYTNGRVYMLAS